MFGKSILDNGMTLVTERVKGFNSLSIGVWVNAGTRHEAADESGMSHFLEHMMFKGTETRSALDIATAVDRVGGEFNAFTTREYTCFHLLLLAQDLPLAVDILGDVLLNSTFDAEELERERKVILQEIAMVEDNPEEYVHDLFFEQALGSHPLGKSILGSRKSIGSFTRAQVFSYFRKHYSPKQMVVAVAGDISHADAKRLLNKKLRKGLLRETSHKKLGMRKPIIHPGKKILSGVSEQAHLVVGFPAIAAMDPDRFSVFLLNNYLGGGMSSALFQEIREKRGLAYTVYSSVSAFSDVGLFSLYVASSPGELPLCVDLIAAELQKLKERKLDTSMIKMLQESLLATIELNLDSVENRMMGIAKSEMFFGKFASHKELERLIRKVSPESIHKMANKLFRSKQMLVTVLGTKKSGAKGLNRSIQNLNKLLA